MKNIFVLLLILALGAAAYFFVFNENFSATPTETNFVLADARERATRIEIIEPNGYKIELEKSKQTSNWFCNEYYLVREDAIEQVLKTVETWRMEKPIKQTGIENIKGKLQNSGKQVKYYFDYKHNKPVKHYYISGGPSNRKGAYMMLEGGESPYIVSSTHIIGSPEIMFHTVLEKWRTHKIFGGESSDISKLTVEYPNDAKYSFEINRDKDGSLGLAGNLKANISDNKLIDELSLKVLFDKIPKMNIESFDNLYTEKETITNTQPYRIINIESPDSKLSQELKIFRMPVNEKTKLMKMPEGEVQLYDNDRFYATLNKGKDFVVVQQFGLAPIIDKKHSSFFKD